MQNKKQNFIDVTDEWISNANPNSYEIKELDYWVINNKKHKVDGKKVLLDYSKSELECAKWLESTFGGEIYMCPRINIPEGIKTPDFIWNGEYWDLKEIKSFGKRTIDNRVNGSRLQTRNYILDINKNNMSDNIAIKKIKEIYSSKDREWISTIILKRNDKLLAIIKRS